MKSYLHKNWFRYLHNRLSNNPNNLVLNKDKQTKIIKKN